MSFANEVRAEISSDKKRLSEERLFVRKCFMSGGAVSNPMRTYHLEFSLAEACADRLMGIFSGFGLRPRKIVRKGQFVVYLKEAEEIADALKIMKAPKSLLAFEEMRVEKSIRNNINRIVNFETANLRKTVDASLIQIEAIKIVAEHIGLANLPKPLEEIARLRLENENLTLAEIGAGLTPPIGKSGVNHRMRKICKIAEKINNRK